MSGDPVGMLKTKYSHARRRQLLDLGHQLVRRADVRRAGRALARGLLEEVQGGRRLRRALRQHQRAQPAHRHLGRVPADRRTVAVEHVDLVGDRGGVAGDVGHVGVARHQLERPLLPAAADQDGRPAGLNGPGDVAGLVDPVVPAVEAGRVLA